MTIADKLLELNAIKRNIKTAIEGKGVDMTGVDFGGYAEKIDGINGIGTIGKIETVVELTQAQYDALSVYDDNTCYLIVESVLEISDINKMYKGTTLLYDKSTTPTGPTTPPTYVQTTTADFDSSGNYIGTEEYIILPSNKTSGYKITNINVKGVATNGDYLTDAGNMFRDNNSLYLELDYLDTSNVTSMNSMFQSSQVTTLDLSGFDTSNVTTMGAMFQSSQVTTLNLSGFDTSKVTNMSYMFYDSQATALDLSSFDTSNVTTMYYMFRACQATTLNLSSFNTSNVTTMGAMFRQSAATTLDLSSFDTSKVTDVTYMFSSSPATTGYARTQTDANKFNSSSFKPATLTFVVK